MEEETYPRPIYRGKVGIFPSPRAYIQEQVSESKDIFLNMISSGGRKAWREWGVRSFSFGG